MKTDAISFQLLIIRKIDSYYQNRKQNISTLRLSITWFKVNFISFTISLFEQFKDAYIIRDSIKAVNPAE
jgi:hypothetical protein